MNKSEVVRGHGPLDNFAANLRHNKAKSLIGQCKGNKAILDIGCGPYPLFLESIEFSSKVGIDFSIDVDIQYKDTKIYKLDLESIELFPFSDNSFDIITMLAVLEHITPGNVPRLLAEIERTLSPNGILVITTPAPWADWLLRTLASLNLLGSEEIEDHKAAYGRSKLQECLTDAGFCKKNIRIGFFELFLNVWATAVK